MLELCRQVASVSTNVTAFWLLEVVVVVVVCVCACVCVCVCGSLHNLVRRIKIFENALEGKTPFHS